MEVLRKLRSLVIRTAQRFNAESRAHRVLDKQQAGEVRPAPKYEASVRELERTLSENPEIIQKLSQKNAPLDDRLKKVYVTSETEILPNPESSNIESLERPLPLNRKTPEEFEFGYMESQKVPRGKISMRNVLEMLNEHQLDAENATAVKFSKQYKVKESYIQDILSHYRMLSVHIGDPKIKKLPKTPREMLLEGESIRNKM